MEDSRTRVYSTSLNSGEYILIEGIYDIVFIKEILGFIQTSVSDSAQSNTEAIYEPRIILNPGKSDQDYFKRKRYSITE